MKKENLKFKNSTIFLPYFFSFLFSFLIVEGCGGAVVELTNTSGATIEGTSLNLSPQEKIYVAAAFFTDTVGSIAAVGSDSPHPVQTALAVTDSSDVILRSFNAQLFAVNRGTASIQVIDPDTFKILGNYSVGPSSNPQDIVVHNGKAYITRLDSQLDTTNTDDLWIVNPLTGELIQSIDLKPFTANDGNRVARAAGMAQVGDFLYILLQDLSSNFKATASGKVVVLDTTTDTVVDVNKTTDGTQVIQLTGRNPTSIVYSPAINRLFIADTGYFDDFFNNDPATLFGGIELIDPGKNTTFGILIDDLLFGGYLSNVALVSATLGLVTVDASRVASFNPTTLAVLETNLYTSPGSFLPELLVDKNDLLWIPERNSEGNGLLKLDPSNGALLSGPLGVGAFPLSMTLIQ